MASLEYPADVQQTLLDLKVARISSEIKMEKFIEITKRDKGFDKENSWYRFCENQRIPFITIRAHSKLADVQWDYMSYPPNLDKALFTQHERIKIQMSRIYDRYVSKDAWFSAGPGVITFRNLDIDHAREVAAELYDIIVEAVRIALDKPQRK